MASTRTGAPTGAVALTRRIGLLVGLLVLLNLAVMFFLVGDAANGRDQVAIADSEQTARSALFVALEQLGRVVRDYAEWDDAYDHLVVNFDPAWAEAEMGRYLADDHRVTHVVLVDGMNRIVYRHGETSPETEPSPHPEPGSPLARLIGAARAQIPPGPPATALLRVGSTVYLAAANRVARSDGTDQGIPADRPVLVFMQPLDDARLAGLAVSYNLRGLRLSPFHRTEGDGLELPLRVTADHSVVGYLTWELDLPGRAILRDLMIPVVVSALGMLLILWKIMADARGAGRDLDAEREALNLIRTDLELRVAARTAAVEAKIRECRQAEQALREAEARYSSIFENAAEGIFQVTPDGHYLSCNPALARILGFGSAQSLATSGHNPLDADPGRRREFMFRMETEGAVRDFVTEVRRHDGTALWLSQNARAVRNREGVITYYEGMVTDITERKRAEERLIHEALHDPLTGLPNRALFLHRLAQAIRKAPAGPAPAFGLLFIDCDRFKLINDSLGHQVGDQLLITLGQRLAGTVRPTDTLARLGGDEFAVLVENLSSASEVLAIAERIHAAFEPAVDLADSQVVVTVSIGVALDLPEGGSPIDMLRDADTAMYRAKADGRGRTVVFDGTMHREVVRRLKTETDLRRAIDRGELRVYYQPICRLADRSIAGFEALVRWQRDDGGLVAPGDFIPIAEETGLIEPIGEWVLVEACRQVEAWRRARHQDPKDLFVSVNLSPVQLSRGDMVKRIDAIVTASGLPAGNLKLEVTETAFMTSAEGARVMLRALAERGIRLSIDDFGTGYSSLSLLHSFPFDTLKIDRSFVARLNSTREHSEIVRTILMLGRSLHLSVVAEGVETSAQCEWLLASGCPYAQGHLFSRPVPVDAAERLLLSQRGCWPGDLTGDRLCA